MTIYYSATTNAFYDTAIHGTPTIQVPDPDWVRPTKEVPDPNWVPDGDQTEADRPTITVPDEDTVHPTIEQPNPDCKIPDGSVEITKEKHQQLLNSQSQGKRIQAKTDGTPEAADKPLTPIDTRRKIAKDTIDTAAGKARERYVSKGYLIEEEYRLAKQQVDQWRIDGSPAASVPPSVQSWADALGRDAETAAQEIEATSSAWEQVIEGIRSLRLSGKATVDSTSGQGKEDDMAIAAQPFIDQLDALKP